MVDGGFMIISTNITTKIISIECDTLEELNNVYCKVMDTVQESKNPVFPEIRSFRRALPGIRVVSNKEKIE